MRRQNGFSLIELMLTVAVLLVIMAIAVPSFLRARMAANESSAVASMHSIDTAQISYAAQYPQLGFAPDLSTLGPGPISGNFTSSSSNAVLLDDVLGCAAGVGTAPCEKSGYNFNIAIGSGAPANTYQSHGDPLAWNKSAVRYFYSDNSDVIRFNTTAIATQADQAIQ